MLTLRYSCQDKSRPLESDDGLPLLGIITKARADNGFRAEVCNPLLPDGVCNPVRNVCR